MGNYIDQADVEARLRDSFAALYKLPADRDHVTDDIAKAEAIVDAYVGRRYSTPATAASAKTFLESLTLDLLEEIAWGRSVGEELPKKVAERAKVAREQLESIARGTIVLVGASPLTGPPGGASGGIAVVEGNAPEFDREKMTGF